MRANGSVMQIRGGGLGCEQYCQVAQTNTVPPSPWPHKTEYTNNVCSSVFKNQLYRGLAVTVISAVAQSLQTRAPGSSPRSGKCTRRLIPARISSSSSSWQIFCLPCLDRGYLGGGWRESSFCMCHACSFCLLQGRVGCDGVCCLHRREREKESGLFVRTCTRMRLNRAP
jgi:hypothetical protein